ncbi:NLR family CARD domain-containing protein 3-like [Dysidea avara]|uniref:NLR family CARD domain-containing protein 3-like n=1 Tax=Dysidea avara TaxID=196820 RepID=UPI003327F8BC
MQLKHFGLCNSSFQNGDGIVLTKALQCISNLHRLTFKKTNITAEFADSIGTILSVNTHLQHLDLDGNDLQGSGAIAISRSLQNVSMITSLHMNDNNISEDAADDIAYTISSHSCTKLQELGLSRNKLQTAGIIKIMKALQRVSTLVKLWIDNNNITEEATGSIAAALSHNVNVQEFVIGGNNIRTEGAMLIAKALRGNSELVRFCIDNNNITDKAAVEVAAVLSNNTALQELSIYENGFQSTGAVTIFKALHSMSSLIMLDISNNEIDDEASNDIAVVLHNNRGLQQVNIGGNGFQTMGANRISKALHCITALLVLDVNYNEIDSEAADDLAAALLHNAQLQELNIGGNDFQTAGIIKIAEALQNTTTLRVLDISNNNVTEEAADSIAVVVSRNTLLQVLNISGNEFQTLGIVKVLNALQRCLLLAIIDISNNSITDDAADDLVALLCCCSQLQELYINDNDLCTEGLLKIVKCIQNVSVLTLLDFNHNHLTDEVESCMVSKLTDKKHLHVFNLLESAVKMKILNSINNVSKITGESGWSDNRQIFPGKWKTRQMLMQSWDAELLLKKFVPYMYSQIKSVQLLPKDDTIHRKRKFSSVKVVVVGDDSVGKSCFITHYVTEKCDLFQHATIGSNIMMKMINHNGIVSKLQIWDTSGCQRYNALLDGYIQQTRGIFVLFDFTNWTSFVNVQKFWINKGPSDCYKVLVGYKCDLVHLRQVPEKKIVEFSNLHNLKYFETSARTGININEAFLAIYKSIISMS